MKNYCLQCEKDFHVANWDKNRKFCSKECSEKYLDTHNRIVKICKVCEKEFKCSKTEGEWKICCSAECSSKLKDKMKREGHEVRKCVVCEKEFEIYKCWIRKCCSKQCRKIWENRKNVKEICVICGKEKLVSPSRHRAIQPICNSDKCRSELMSKLHEGELNPNFIGRVKKVDCIVCGKDVKDYNGNKKFCSNDCKGKWQIENLKGENNPFFGKHHTQELKESLSKRFSKGETKNINRAIRGTSKMKDWRNAVYERDNWTCQECGDRSGIGNPVVLNAHHKVSLSDLIEMYPDIEVKYKVDQYQITNDDFFFDVSNGVAFCDKCHKKVHEKVGIFSYGDE